MSGWGMPEVAEALPDVNIHGATAVATVPETATAESKNPQEHGANAIDYSVYVKSNNPELAVAMGDGPLGVESGAWASNSAIYEWNDDFGDVGPEYPDLEKQLFGGEFRMRTGIEFKNITSLEVHQEGAVRVEPVRKFEDAGLHPVMLRNVKLAGYEVPTPIQQYCFPAIKLGHDVVACAQTGSGKTAAFLIPILSKLMGKAKKLAAPRPNPATYQEGITPPVRAEPLVLIVCPSRELATQIFDEARRFCYRTMLRPCVVYGGGPVGEQIRQLQKGCDLLIGSPGRLVDIINRPHVLTLKRLKYMVIDEADEMLNSDWETELKQIMSGGDQEEGNINYMMFSATFPKIARQLAKEHLAHEHVKLAVGRAGSSHINITQNIVYTDSYLKRKALEDLLFSSPPARTIIFVNSKRTADELDDYLFNKSFPCVSIHSDRTQREREDCMRAFRLGKSPLLIATGVSARGLDIHNVVHVINYDLPSSQYGGIEEYTHRIGRTGRIGNLGLATSFYTERDSDIAEALVKVLCETHQQIPDFLAEFIPEGFTADGQGDVNLLQFEVDSDDGEGGVDNGQNAGGDAWGAAPEEPATAGWGVAPTETTSPTATPTATWGAAPSKTTAPTAAPTSTWGAEPTAPVAAQGTWTAAPPSNNGWSAPQQSFVAPVAPAGAGPSQPQSSASAVMSHGPVGQGTQHQNWSAPAPAVAQTPVAYAQGAQPPAFNGPPSQQWGATPVNGPQVVQPPASTGPPSQQWGATPINGHQVAQPPDFNSTPSQQWGAAPVDGPQVALTSQQPPVPQAVAPPSVASWNVPPTPQQASQGTNWNSWGGASSSAAW